MLFPTIFYVKQNKNFKFGPQVSTKIRVFKALVTTRWSFDTLDDLLGCQVQKSWSKVI